MNELVKTQENENGDIIVSGRELHEFLEAKIKYGVFCDLECFVGKMMFISENSTSSLEVKYNLLKLGVETFDYFHLITLDSFFELLYSLKIIDEDLTDNKRIPSGTDYKYGKFFEKRVIHELSKHVEVKSTQYKSTDAIISFMNNDYIVEVKCGFTDTKKQIERYQECTGIKKFITVNGHENSISFNQLDVYKIAKGIISEKLKSKIKTK
jgi:hypothetical protein